MKGLAIFVAWIGNSLCNALAFQVIWNLYIAPIGVMELVFWHAYGVGFIGSWLDVMTMQTVDENGPAKKAPIAWLVAKSIAMILIVGGAMLVHWVFM